MVTTSMISARYKVRTPVLEFQHDGSKFRVVALALYRKDYVDAIAIERHTTDIIGGDCWALAEFIELDGDDLSPSHLLLKRTCKECLESMEGSLPPL